LYCYYCRLREVGIVRANQMMSNNNRRLPSMAAAGCKKAKKARQTLEMLVLHSYWVSVQPLNAPKATTSQILSASPTVDRVPSCDEGTYCMASRICRVRFFRQSQEPANGEHNVILGSNVPVLCPPLYRLVSCHQSIEQ